MIKMSGKIYIIGIGPGASEYLTKKALDTVKMSDYTVGSTRAIDLFDDVQNKIAFNVKDLLDKLEEGVQLAVDGNTVSILSTGDPGFSGVLNTVLRISNEKNFPKENIEVIPGISSLQLAAAKCHIQWDNANVMTFHGRENIEDILPVINNGKVTIALPSRKVKDMAQFLIDNGVEEDRHVTVCERLSYPDEKIVSSTLNCIAQSEFTYMCIIIIYPYNCY
jgi:cobalt-precorrin-7 (C5)-methyltransferase